MTSFTYSGILTCIFSVFFGLFVLWKGPRKPANRLWFFTCLSIAMWSLGLGMLTCVHSQVHATRWLTFQYVGCIMIPILFVHFVVEVLEAEPSFWLLTGYAAAGILMVSNFTGSLVFPRSLPPYTFYAGPGKIYI